MASFRTHHDVFVPSKPLPQMCPTRPLTSHADSRPVEPLDVRHAYQPAGKPRLPSLQDLLSPPIRLGRLSPKLGGWNDRLPPPVNATASGHGIPYTGAPVLGPPHQHTTKMTMADQYKASMHPSTNGASHLPALSTLPLRPTELSSPAATERRDHVPQNHDYLSSSPYHSSTGDERAMVRRPSSVRHGITDAGGVYSRRIVGQRDIPGEGLCYVFMDGSTLQMTDEEGTLINPLWGKTKAGKARKRLAQACLNCREKKIKCEPGDITCLPCEKSKRDCHMASIPHTQAGGLAGTAHSMSPDSKACKPLLSPRISMSLEVSAPKRRRSAHLAQQESALEKPCYDMEGINFESKRPRSDDSSPSPAKAFSSTHRPRKDSKRPFADEDEQLPVFEYSVQGDLTAPNEDPYQVEPHGTMLFLDLFCTQSAHETRILFPRNAFTRWVQTSDSKSQRDCMVLYSLLALGSTFSNQQYSSFAKLCLHRASQAVAGMYGRFSTALIQARLLLGAYNHMRREDDLAWDYNGSALRAIGAMRLNTEEGCSEEADKTSHPCFNFTREQMRECGRRTFWAGFLMDRYNSFCSGSLSTMNDDDVFIRLPCDERMYEDGAVSSAPFFDTSQLTHSIRQSPTAHVISVSSLWNEVAQFTQRSVKLPVAKYQIKHELFSNDIQRRLSDWNQALPQHLKYSRETLERAVYHDYAGDFVSMHTLHLLAHLTLARTIRHELLPANTVARSICTAHSYALQLLALQRDVTVLTLAPAPHNRRITDFMSPFIARAMTSAIDTLGAGGLREEIVATKEVLFSAVEALGKFSRYCSTACDQYAMARDRLQRIEQSSPALDIEAGKVVDRRCWRISEPMDKTLGLHQDVMYGVSPMTFSEALLEGRTR